VDIWAFGMSIIELTTLEYPYSECENIFSVRQNVIKGIKPQALLKIADNQLFDFIWNCLACDPDKRFSAEQLLNHPFIVEKDENDPFIFVNLRDPEEVDQLVEQYGTTKEGWLDHALRNANFCKNYLENQNIIDTNIDSSITESQTSNNGNEPATNLFQKTISRSRHNKHEKPVSSDDELVSSDLIPVSSYHEHVSSDDEIISSGILPLKYSCSKFKNLQKKYDLSSSEDVLLEDFSTSFDTSDTPPPSPIMIDHEKFRKKTSESRLLKSTKLSSSREKTIKEKVDKLVKRNLVLFEMNVESPLTPKKQSLQ